LRFSVFPFLLLISCLLLSFGSKGKPTLTFGIGVFPRDVVVDPESGRCKGHLIDIVNKVFAESDLHLNIVCAPISRIYRMFANGEIDLTITSKTIPQLQGLVTFVSPPYRELHLSLFSHQNNKPDKTISAVRGYQYNGQRKRLQELGFEFYDLPDISSALRFFMKKRSAYLLSYRTSIIILLNKHPYKFEHHIIEKKVDTLTTYFAISNKSAIFEQIKSALHLYAKKQENRHFFDGKTKDLYLSDISVSLDSE
jgi:polar amino acid transport system substrate-binding protein